jgi:hypothetical protein
MLTGKRQRVIICLCSVMLAGVSLVSADSDNTGYLHVVNPGSRSSEKYLRGWRVPVTRRELAVWGADRGFVLDDDHEPVVDNIAAYVSRPGSAVAVRGLERGVRYRAWIDFVRFRYGAEEPASLLKIFVDAPGAGRHTVASLVPGDITDGYMHVDIPVELSSRGTVELVFMEYARQPGSWGVWDIVVTNGLDLPGRGSLPGLETINLEINDRIVQ